MIPAFGGAVAAVPALVIPVEEMSQVGEARRAAAAMAESLGFDEHGRSDVAVVASELSTNLARYTTRGALVLQTLDRGEGTPRGMELIAVDAGPGMADPERCLTDGFSSGGTAGTGLGAVRRIAGSFAIDSHVGRGTVIVARLWRDRGSGTPPGDWDSGAIAVPAPGERACGDAWAVQLQENGTLVAVVADGLGHGDMAAEASALAINTFRRHATTMTTPAALLERMHEALRATRGAAVAVVALDGASARFAGAGNIAGVIVTTADQRHMVSHNGIVGHQVHKIQEFTYPCPAGATVVLASDGLRTQWRLDPYPGLARREATLVAATLWRDYTRVRDDATALVIRVPGAA